MIYLKSEKEPLDENAVKLEDVLEFYIKNKNKVADTPINVSENSIITFRSEDSSFAKSSADESNVFSESSTISDDSPIAKKRKRKDSKNDLVGLPLSKRSK